MKIIFNYLLYLILIALIINFFDFIDTFSFQRTMSLFNFPLIDLLACLIMNQLIHFLIHCFFRLFSMIREYWIFISLCLLYMKIICCVSKLTNIYSNFFLNLLSQIHSRHCICQKWNIFVDYKHLGHKYSQHFSVEKRVFLDCHWGRHDNVYVILRCEQILFECRKDNEKDLIYDVKSKAFKLKMIEQGGL